MPFPPVPPHSKSEINKSGKTLLDRDSDPDDFIWATNVLSDWRACHAYPINTFRSTLTRKLKAFEGNPIVAQRLKRLPTIIDKLNRYPDMQLSRMQDIGGVRAIVKSVKDVRELADIYRDRSRFQHELVGQKDYITTPRQDGYRSVHLIYKYKNDRAREYNGLLLELQIRTKLQHAWATAVETMGTFLGQALKSRQGDEEWLNFFALTSSAFAHIEKIPLTPGYEHLSNQETFKAVGKAAQELAVLEKMKGFTLAVSEINKKDKGSYYHLIILNSEEKTVEIKSYARDRLKEAAKEYSDAEARATLGEKIEPVLVAAGPLSLLRRAYPNFFLDINDFIQIVDTLIHKGQES